MAPEDKSLDTATPYERGSDDTHNEVHHAGDGVSGVNDDSATIPMAIGDKPPADYGIGLSTKRQGRPVDDARSDEEVIEDARMATAFPTLLGAFPTSPEGPKRPISAKERRAAKRAFRHDLKDARRKAKSAGREQRTAEKGERQHYKSISRLLKERDRELSRENGEQRKRRRAARSVYAAIGFDRMFANGVCEVEQGLYSESIAFSDVSYQSAIEESQKATFNVLADCAILAETTASITFSMTLIEAQRRRVRSTSDSETRQSAEAASRSMIDRHLERQAAPTITRESRLAGELHSAAPLARPVQKHVDGMQDQDGASQKYTLHDEAEASRLASKALSGLHPSIWAGN